ncbi:SPOR domain-containing protein [Spirochaetia bacterium 38H-sp]|uniref:SPOR domain-containing protein n=1 Tax=Rarispira pelagica TaxID=3141764 RepID=A0ABU9UB46_9SPIR
MQKDNYHYKIRKQIFREIKIYRLLALFFLFLLPAFAENSEESLEDNLELKGDIAAALSLAKEQYVKSHSTDAAIRLSRLYYETGDFANAELTIRDILGDAKASSDKKAKALLVLSHIYIATYRFEEADVILSSLVKLPSAKPDIYYTAVLLKVVSGQKNDAQTFLDALKNNFPDSPETHLAQNLIEGSYGTTLPYPPQGILLPPQNTGDEPSIELTSSDYDNKNHSSEPSPEQSEPSPSQTTAEENLHVALQLGSFSVKENAEHYADEVKNKYNIDTEVVPIEFAGKRYYRVIIPQNSRENAQNLLTELKNKGLESFIIFY